MGDRRMLAVLLAALAAVGLVFGLLPSLDLSASAPFASEEGGFPLRTVPALTFLREIGMQVPYLVLTAYVLSLLLPIVFPAIRPFADARRIIAAILVFALGPGLVANVILKEFWDRPRPVQVVEFGGNWTFRPWYDPSGECHRNCSFVSGEGASATALVAAALALPPPFRTPAVVAASVFAIGVSGLRLAFGGHFLSDLLFAALFTLLIAWGAFRLMLDPRYPWGRAGAIEAWLRGLAVRLRGGGRS